jgi:uncharacterized protein (TIGR03083 family)
MEPDPAPWISALRRSHDALQALTSPLQPDQLRQQSYASEWSIAQVLSHLGSQAEIFGLFLDSGQNGQDPPGRETFESIWQRWNSKSPQAQAEDGLRVDGEAAARLAALDGDQLGKLRLAMFGRELNATELARMRLGEHAVHSWDIAVALDPSATLAADATELLVDALDQIVTRTAKPAGSPRTWRIATTGPRRWFRLAVDETATLAPAEEGRADLTMPAEAFIRLIYGRLDPGHTPPVEGEAAADLDVLRALFPGF